MFKRIILILALICMIVLPVFSQTGNYTENEFFYLPLYGAYGMDEYNEYNLYMQKADTQIEANKGALGDYYLKTAIDTLGEVETIYSADIVDTTELATALGDYYLKADIDTLSEVETIYTKDITDSDELASALTAYYLKTAIDSLSEVETIYSKDITDSTELASALADYYLKTAIDTLGEVETIYGTDIVDTTEMATALTDYYLKTAIDTQGEMETIWSVSLANTGDLHASVTIGTANGLSLSTQAISMALADTDTIGALSDTDWDTFNNKLSDITGESIGSLSNVDLTDLADEKILKYNFATSNFECEDEAGAGETNTASNIGAEIEIYKQKTGVDLELRTLKANSSKITISNTTDAVLKMSNEVNTSDAYVDDDQSSGQYWLADSGYTLGLISVFMREWATGGNITMQVYEADADGLPTGAELGSIVVDCTGIGGTNVWVDFDLTSESITIVNATRYCWYLSGVTPSNGVITRYSADQIANSWRIWYGTGAWNKSATSDITFKLYTTADPLDYIKFDIVETEMDVVNLLSTTTVSFAADADTTLYTVPTGKRCVLSHAIVIAALDAGATTTVSIGQNTAETDFIPANTLSNLDAQYDSVILQPIPNTTPLKIKSYAAATVIEARVASQSGAVGNTIYLFGILY